MKKLFLFSFLVLVLNGLSQETLLNPILSGPMLGYVEAQEALVWLEVKPSSKSVTITYWPEAYPLEKKSKTLKLPIGQDFLPVQLKLTGLKLNTSYKYELIIDKYKLKTPYSLAFKTKKMWGMWDKKKPEDYAFVMGSCAYTNEKGFERDENDGYGNSPKMFETMANTPAEFMLWLGDNVYLREPDYTTEYGIKHRYSYTRATPELKKLLATKSNFAIWDDHDYGPNDGNSSYPLKNYTLQAFKDYWGNLSYGESDNPGTYSRFSWFDSDFFLLDNRYYRSAELITDSIGILTNDEKYFLGPKQLTWLKNSLLNSAAPFKFIACGSQVLNPYNPYECFRHYSSEFYELINFIKEKKISGVIFLTGDRHHSEIIKQDFSGLYTLYDITSSAITSKGHMVTGKEKNNPYRLDNSLIEPNNFGRISISGDKGNRLLIYSVIDINGKEVYSWQINENDLKIK